MSKEKLYRRKIIIIIIVIIIVISFLCFVAVSCEHREMVQLLLSCHADVTVADSDGSTVNDVASDDMKTLLQAQGGSG